MLKNGSDFGVLAEELSIDPSAKVNGGELGYAKRGLFVKEFEDAAFALDIGEISEPVESQFGYHVIQVLDKRDARGAEEKAPELKEPDEVLNETIDVEKELQNEALEENASTEIKVLNESEINESEEENLSAENSSWNRIKILLT